MKQAKNVNTELVLKALWREARRAEKLQDWGKEAGLSRATEIVEWFASRPKTTKPKPARTASARSRSRK